MSGTKSRSKLLRVSPNEPVQLIRHLIDKLRNRGLSVQKAQDDLASILGVTQSRVRKLYWKDGDVTVREPEWRKLCARASVFLLEEARRKRQEADRDEQDGHRLAMDQTELNLGMKCFGDSVSGGGG